MDPALLGPAPLMPVSQILHVSRLVAVLLTCFISQCMSGQRFRTLQGREKIGLCPGRAHLSLCQLGAPNGSIVQLDQQLPLRVSRAAACTHMRELSEIATRDIRSCAAHAAQLPWTCMHLQLSQSAALSR